jgi:hypothetical protein
LHACAPRQCRPEGGRCSTASGGLIEPHAHRDEAGAPPRAPSAKHGYMRHQHATPSVLAAPANGCVPIARGRGVRLCGSADDARIEGTDESLGRRLPKGNGEDAASSRQIGVGWCAAHDVGTAPPVAFVFRINRLQTPQGHYITSFQPVGNPPCPQTIPKESQKWSYLFKDCHRLTHFLKVGAKQEDQVASLVTTAHQEGLRH